MLTLWRRTLLQYVSGNKIVRTLLHLYMSYLFVDVFILPSHMLNWSMIQKLLSSLFSIQRLC